MIGTHGIPKNKLITVLLEVHKCTTNNNASGNKEHVQQHLQGTRVWEQFFYSERERSIQSTNTFWEKQIKQYRLTYQSVKTKQRKGKKKTKKGLQPSNRMQTSHHIGSSTCTLLGYEILRRIQQYNNLI